MIHFPNNTVLVQSLSELPNLTGFREIVLDFETTSGDPKLSSLNPWHHCSVAGVCICVTGSPGYYVPIGHKRPTRDTPNLDKSLVTNWLFDQLSKCSVLIGHNIKYDAHVLTNDLGILFDGELYDTLTQAKLLHSDRQSYGLDALSKDWLKCDISKYELALAPYLYDGKGHKVNQDYGEIPAYVMAPYGGQDVLSTLALKEFIQSKLPASCSKVSKNEVALTKVLLNLENVGLCVDPVKVQFKKIETSFELTQIIYKLRELTGIEMRPNTTEDCYQFLCGEKGLPVLKWTNEDDPTKKSNPSFDKEAMTAYEHLPQVQLDPGLRQCVGLIQKYRTLDTFNSLFLETFQARHVGGRLHSDYNQCVSTGRLSCSDPNAQQMSSMAKGLIECPDKDWLILDIDLSQIDYRVVASATNNPNVVSSYVNDPSTDYHGMVGKLAGISRRHGKTLNLAIGFGMGERSAVALVKKTLKADSEEFLTSGMEFTDYCEQRSKKMYKDYHLNLPELKATSNRATSIAKQNGYIANIHGRRRHFPEPRYMTIKGKNKLVSFYHRAFASYVQSSAADIAKFLTVQIDELIRNNPLVKLVAVVHDSWVFYVHKSVYMGLALEISRIIRSVDTLRVPILNSCEISSTNWAACKPIPNFNFNFGYW